MSGCEQSYGIVPPEQGEPTSEQVKEVWERCGLQTKYSDENQCWFEPDGTLIDCGFWEWHPPIDLNNLFKYAVPIVLSKMKWTEWFHFMVSWAIRIFEKEDPALALFWLIREKVIHG